MCLFFFFFKQKTAYEMRISDWSSDVCSSDLYNSGGFNPSVPASQEPSAPQPAYGPEYIRDYEVGIKADWRLAGMPVRTNLSGFYSKYTNIQRSTFGVSDTGQTYIGISNGPKATTYGMKLEETIQTAAGLLLNAKFGRA